MKRKLIYHDPKSGQKIYLSEFTLIVLALIVGGTVVGCAYCIGWGAGFVAMAAPATLLLRKHLGIFPPDEASG